MPSEGTRFLVYGLAAAADQSVTFVVDAPAGATGGEQGESVSVPTISQVLTELVLEAAEAAGHGDVLDRIEPAQATANPRFGDYQSNHAFRLGKALRTNPRAVAEAVKAALPEHPAVSEASVAGPGFLNFRLDRVWLAQKIFDQGRDPAGGVPQSGAGQTVVIDYSSPNVAKRMHVGHMRSTIIGNALHRMHQAAGWTVVADNHIGDWGTQYGKLMAAWERWRDEDAFDADPIGELERLYVHFGDVADEGLQAHARALTARLQAGDAELLSLWDRFVSVSLAEFDKVYDRLGVAFDVTLGESFYNPVLSKLVDTLVGGSVAEESDGAVVIKFTGEDPAEQGVKGLKDKVLVVRKQDGAFLYGTTDLATLDHRMATWSPSRIIYVTDGRQQLHFKQVFAAWTRYRRDCLPVAASPQLVHTWFGTLKFSGGAMSSRSGNIVRLVEFIDEAVRRAREAVDEKNPDLPEEERAAIAEAIGVSAVRYSDLSQNPQSDVTFDWDRMLALEGNTAPFLIYSYARSKSILRRAGAQTELSAPVLQTDAEVALAHSLSRYPEVVELALETRRPNMLCDHLFEVAQQLNRFYAQDSVLGADDLAVRSSRLHLVALTSQVLARGFQALGLRPLERM